LVAELGLKKEEEKRENKLKSRSENRYSLMLIFLLPNVIATAH